MSSLKVARVYLMPQSILLKQVDAFSHIAGFGIEYKAASQWYQDIYAMSQQAKEILKPLVDVAKDLEEKSKADPENAELKTQFDAANEALQASLAEQQSMNIVTLKVKAAFAKPSINEYAVLRSLHQLKFINCDLFDDNEEEPATK